MYVATSILKFNIVGFNSLGLFSFLILIFVGTVVVWQLAQKIASLSSGVDKQIATEQKTSEELEKKVDQGKTSVAQVQHNWILSVSASVLLISSISVFMFPHVPTVRNAIMKAINQAEKAPAHRDTNWDVIGTKTKAEVVHKNEGNNIKPKELQDTVSKAPERKLQSITPMRRVARDNLTGGEVQSVLKQYDLYCALSVWSKEWCNPQGKGLINNFELLHNGKVVVDHATGLMWQQSGSAGPITFADAQKYILELNTKTTQGFVVVGFNEWRLPTLDEAMSLMEREKTNGLHIDPIFDPNQWWIWTVDKANADTAWVVTFDAGRCTYGRFNIKCYVRAVR